MADLVKDDMREREPRPASKSKKSAGRTNKLTNEDLLFIIWCWSRGLSSAATSKGVKCNVSTVLQYRKRVFRQPYIVFDLAVMVKQGERKYLCRFCGGREPSEIRCKRHILKHFMPLEYAKQISLKPPDY